jgi:hypothetical protein
VAFFAHVGGFVFGLVVARILVRTGRLSAGCRRCRRGRALWPLRHDLPRPDLTHARGVGSGASFEERVLTSWGCSGVALPPIAMLDPRAPLPLQPRTSLTGRIRRNRIRRVTGREPIMLSPNDFHACPRSVHGLNTVGTLRSPPGTLRIDCPISAQ